MRLSRYLALSLLISGAVFFATLIIQPYYVNGDQFYYARLYKNMFEQPIWLISTIGYYTLNGAEPLSLLFYWIGSNLHINHTVFEGLLNASLAYGICVFLKDKKVGISVATLIALNGYTFALFFSAIRLKIAIIILLYLISSKRNVIQKMFPITIFAHFSLALLFLCNYIINKIVSKQKFQFRFNLKSFFTIFLLSAIIIMMDPIYVWERFSSKINIYSTFSYDFVDVAKLIIMLLLVYLIIGWKFSLAFALAFTAPLLILGTERVLMLLFFSLTFYVILQGKTKNVFFNVYLYFGVFKTCGYLLNVLLYGDAFHGEW